MTTLNKRKTHASIFLCILCIRTYNKANMTNNTDQQNQTRPLATSATSELARWAYARATAAATKNRPSTCLLFKRDIISIPQKMHRTSLLINEDSAS